MRFYTAFKLAISSILSNKTRAFLTMLGMIIGVASVIILVGLVSGLSDYIVSTMSDMGTNQITVSVTNTGTKKATEEEMYEIAESNASVFTECTATASGSFTIKKGTVNETNHTVKGVGENYLSIASKMLSAGRFISYSDIITKYRSCVVGTYIVETFFEVDDVVGETIKIDGEVFTIVGILEETADSEKSSDDDVLYIPYTTCARMNGTSEITSFTYVAVDTDYVEAGETIIEELLLEKFGSEDNYTVSSMTALLDTVNDLTGMLSLVLSGIAGISLVVAGIGIMNIMLVSVIERTREIGIRKALGAKYSDILMQFVIEAIMISCLGGMMGIVIGDIITINVGNLLGIAAAATVGSVLLSFSFSVAIGVFFGYMPARRAAKLNPIDALRAE